MLPASLIVTGGLRRETPELWGGVWLAQFSLDGSLLGQRILEPGIGSRVSEEETFYVSGTDSAGNPQVIEMLGDFDHPRDATVARYTLGGERTELLTLENLSFLQSTVAADGGFALTIGYFDEVISDPTDDPTLPERSPMRLDLARFDREGRLLWNQPKLGRALELTHPMTAGFDAFGNTVVQLAREGNISIMFDPGSIGALAVERLARVDPKGNVCGCGSFPWGRGSAPPRSCPTAACTSCASLWPKSRTVSTKRSRQSWSCSSRPVTPTGCSRFRLRSMTGTT